ncbi:BatA domain-containing protein [uncultured Massilia sp.]|uniref:BatA domain-containing protein n=1 Tax=uncultured Massilia sp. TaxID=169973 RepID=UPI0025D708F0|nr:BatA domain-containing protein [uncultured Massilia sp.]
MNASLWWWALPVLLLPILWHRRKRQQADSVPLATARFLPRAEPLQRRTWSWDDPLLLLLRCLLLLAALALLADPVWPWRGSAVLVVPGSDPALVEREARAAGLQEAPRLALPDRDAVRWIHAHEREFALDARLLAVGDVTMPAGLPRFRHAVTLRSTPAPAPAPLAAVERHVAVFSARADAWRRLFGAVDGPLRVVVDAQAGAGTHLVVWDRAEAPPAGLRAPLWWIADATAFPELARAPQVHGMRYLDTPRGRLWSADGWPPLDAQEARVLLSDWQRLHDGPRPFTAPPLALAPDAAAPASDDHEESALRERLAWLLVVLFALERMLTHVRRR